MDKQRFEIPYPDEKEMQMEISMILEKGLDPKTSFGTYLMNMYRNIGLRHLFHDWTEILYTLVIALFLLGAMGIGVMEWVPADQLNIYTFIFIGSPLTYFTFAYLFFLNQKQKATYEVEMTCKYNLHQLAAFRMLVFSLFSLMVNGVIILLIAAQKEINVLYAFLISSSALFLFAMAFLYVQLHMKSRQAKWTVACVWVVGNVTAAFYSKDVYQLLLQHIPFYLYGIITVGAAILYIRSLKGLLFSTRMKGLI
ncbi:hypothetical protein [Pseudalkalibacillus sp. SCS-8]|uniref:hypothetical protein n=1 Tax=Pseudalkalibacillus nanhaiensis TaxID=3115291 RepID=UPI0032DAECB0